jgi:hypothetical protein|tara:strand:- start:16 stop:780 length:765 start_codon:yes stop_codon:yes gene_type:complete
MAKNYISINEVIRSLLIQEGDETTHRLFYYRDIALRGVKELNFDVVRNIKTVELTVNANLNITLPTDFVSISRVGVSKNGMIAPVGQLDDIDLQASQAGVTGVSNTYTIQWIDEYRNGENMGGIFGLGGGQNRHGYYRFDMESNTIQFDAGFAEQTITLEYISDGISRLSDNTPNYPETKANDTQIHVFAEEALRAYMYWKGIQRKRTVPANLKEQARRDWFNEKRISKARMKNFTKDEAMQAGNKNSYQAPKF